MGLRDGPVGVKDACPNLKKIEKLALAAWWWMGWGEGAGMGAMCKRRRIRTSQKNNPFHILSNSRSEKDRPEAKYFCRDARAFSRVGLSARVLRIR